MMGGCGTTRKKIVTGACIGAATLCIGIGLIPLINVIVDKKVRENVVLKEGGMLYDIWKNMTIPVYMQFYMFDIQNLDEVKEGGKPYLKQKGPYTYREERYKINITHNPNGTISYRQIRRFYFVPEMSVGNESDQFTTVNPPLLTLLNALKYQTEEVKKLIGLVLYLQSAELFMTRPMKEILWGYTDPLLKVAKKVDPDWFYTDYVGYFINKNDTDDGLYNIFTGETDIKLLGVIDKYNRSSNLNFWTTQWANMINGSDGTLAPPYLQGINKLPTFSSDVCRSVFGLHTEDVKTKQGIPLHRFTGTKAELGSPSLDPDNIGFCTPQSSCFGSGVLNVSTCQLLDNFHIPGAVSLPHFYLADDKYIKGVDGMSPNKEEHETAIDVEPLTGLVLQAAKRLQINMHIQPVPDIRQFYQMKEVVMPIFWVNESAYVDDAHATQIQNMLLTPLLITDIVKYGLIGLGSLILIIALLCGIRLKQNSNNVHGDETKPLLRSDTEVKDVSSSAPTASSSTPTASTPTAPTPTSQNDVQDSADEDP